MPSFDELANQLGLLGYSESCSNSVPIIYSTDNTDSKIAKNFFLLTD